MGWNLEQLFWIDRGILFVSLMSSANSPIHTHQKARLWEINT